MEMADGYKSELAAAKTLLEEAKMALEVWYARKIPEAEIQGEVRKEYDNLMQNCDTAMREATGTMKAIEKKLVPWQL